MMRILLLSLSILCFNAKAQFYIWGAESWNGADNGQFVNSFVETAGSTYDPATWTARTISDNSGNTIPGAAFWSRTLTGTSQGINSNGAVINSPTQSNGAAIFDSDFLDSDGVAPGQGASLATQRGELISPLIDITGYTDSLLSAKFYLKYANANFDEFSISFSTDNGTTWGTSHDILAVHPNNAEGFTSVLFNDHPTYGAVNLTQCRVKLTFEGAYDYVIIDDFSLFPGTANWSQTNFWTYSFSTIAASTCGPYTSPSGNYTWTTSGIYHDTIPNSFNRDSIMTINLTVGNPSSGTDIQSACNAYTWIDGNTYNSSNNTATFTLSNAQGCDSVVTLDLTIIPLPNVNVTQTGTTLEADLSGAVYQWLDCDANFAAINGETNQTFTPGTTGNYAVQVTNNSCSDTSACIVIDFTGINEINHSEKELLKIVDLMGREVPYEKNVVLIYIYTDGTTERVFEFE